MARLTAHLWGKQEGSVFAYAAWEGEALGCCLRTCWSCPVLLKAPPEIKRDIFHHMQEDERSPELQEAFGEGQPLAGAAEGDVVSVPPHP